MNLDRKTLWIYAFVTAIVQSGVYVSNFPLWLKILGIITNILYLFYYAKKRSHAKEVNEYG